MKSWAVPAAVVAVLTALVLGFTHVRAEASLGRSCAAIAERSAARRDAAPVAGSGPTVAVIGDSYSMGLGLEDPQQSWPSRLPGRVVVDGFSGSGFSGAASPCPRVSFGHRVGRALALHPDLVVVQGGLNDYDVPAEEVRAAARTVLRSLRGQPVVLVGPPMAPSRATAVPRVDAVLAHVAARAGVAYVDTSSLALSYLPDRLHLTPEGHQQFGRAVAARIARLGLIPSAG